MENHSIGIGVCGTFGSPHGFQQKFYLDALFGKSLDLNAKAIEVYPGSELYSVKKDCIDDVFSICITVYTYAKELSSSRRGAFIGSSIVLNNVYVSSQDIYNLLIELHRDIVTDNNNIRDGVLQVDKVYDINVRQPNYYNKINPRDISFQGSKCSYNNDEKEEFVFVDDPFKSEQYLLDFFDASLKYFSDIDTLYFTFDERIKSYVDQQGLLSSVTWEHFNLQKREYIKKYHKSIMSKDANDRESNMHKGYSYIDYDYREIACNVDCESEKKFLYDLLELVQDRVYFLEKKSIVNNEKKIIDKYFSFSPIQMMIVSILFAISLLVLIVLVLFLI